MTDNEQRWRMRGSFFAGVAAADSQCLEGAILSQPWHDDYWIFLGRRAEEEGVKLVPATAPEDEQRAFLDFVRKAIADFLAAHPGEDIPMFPK